MPLPVRALLALAVIVSCLGIWNAGCSKPPKRPEGPTKAAEDELQTALESIRRATTNAGYREGLNLFNAQISKADRQRLSLSAKARELLQERFHLDADELNEVEAGSFSPLDAHHLEACYQMRETARFLEQEGLSPLEQATRCFEWVVRQVDLHERTDELLPPQLVLRLGQGTAAERALVFLAVVHQFQLDGCIVALPGERADEPGPLVVGVLLTQDKKAQIYLFDPRLGRPLPGPAGKSVATLADLRAQPELFWPSGKPADAKSELTVFLAPPLSTLSPRMRYLETFLVDRDRVYVAHDPEKLLKEVEQAAGSPVRVWNRRTPAGGATTPVTPLRVLRAFLNPGEGGTDRTGRSTFIQLQRFAGLPTVLRNYSAMQLINRGDLAPPARAFLLDKTLELFSKYAHAGRDFLIRGQFAQLRQRINILNEPLNQLDLEIDPKRIVEWRDRVNGGVLRNQPAAVFAEDRYFFGLLEGRADLDRKDIRELTIIVLKAIREPITQDFVHLRAHAEQEEAEKMAARKAAGKAVKGAGHIQWREAENEWQRYVSGFGLTPTKTAGRISLLQEFFKERDSDNLLVTTEQLMTDLHKTFSARVLLARDLAEGGKRGQAVVELQAVIADLKELEKRDLGKELAAFANLRGDRPWTRRFESFQKDVGPEGGFVWLRRAAELQLREWTAKN